MSFIEIRVPISNQYIPQAIVSEADPQKQAMWTCGWSHKSRQCQKVYVHSENFGELSSDGNSAAEINGEYFLGLNLSSLQLIIWRKFCRGNSAAGNPVRISLVSSYQLRNLSSLNLSSDRNSAAEIHSENFCQSNCSRREADIIWKFCGGTWEIHSKSFPSLKWSPSQLIIIFSTYHRLNLSHLEMCRKSIVPLISREVSRQSTSVLTQCSAWVAQHAGARLYRLWSKQIAVD